MNGLIIPVCPYFIKVYNFCKDKIVVSLHLVWEQVVITLEWGCNMSKCENLELF